VRCPSDGIPHCIRNLTRNHQETIHLPFDGHILAAGNYTFKSRVDASLWTRSREDSGVLARQILRAQHRGLVGWRVGLPLVRAKSLASSDYREKMYREEVGNVDETRFRPEVAPEAQ
jgi:hypothetical protein